MSIRVGSVVGDYEVLELLGAGGVGVVFKVRHKIMGRIEAMKVLLPGSAYAPEHAQRFLREVEVQANLTHPNIASVLHAFQFDGSLVMVMELVEGEALDKTLARVRLPLSEALDYASQALAALGYAHSRGVVHRDVKPSNMLVTPQGLLKMSDFGLAKRATDSRLTATHSALGSLFYMSPEQVNGLETIDERTDIYSMGVVLYELTTGKRPFESEQPFQLMLAHVEWTPSAPNEVEPSVSKPLSDLILRALEKQPDNRYQSTADFLNAIVALDGALSVPKNTTALPPSVYYRTLKNVEPEADRVRHGTSAAVQQRPLGDGAKIDHYAVAARLLTAVRGKGAGWRSLVPAAVAVVMLLGLGLWAGYFPQVSDLSRSEIVSGTELATTSIDLDLGALELPVSTAVASGRHEFVRTIISGSAVEAIAISADGSRLAVSNRARNIEVWDAYSGERVASLPNGVVSRALTISSDGKLLAFSSSDGRLRLWEPDAGMKPVEFDFHGGAQTVAFSDDNRLLAVAYPDSLAVWDVSDTSFPWQTKQHQLSAIAFAFSPDSNTVAVASTNDSIELVPLDILATPRTIGIDGGVTALSFSSDGLWLAAAGKDGVKIWQQDATDALLSRGSGQYLTVAITPFGRCIALTLDRETAEVWDATLDNQVSALRHSQELTTAALSKNGQVAVTATLAGDLWIWKASFGWDRPRSSETLLTRFTGAPKKASVKDRANPTPIHRRQVEQRSEESRSPSGRPPLGAHSVTAQESAPAQPKLPAVSVRAEKPPGAPPQEEPTEDAQITPEPVRSAEADAFADPQDESADQAEDQKNPDKKTKNIFRKVLGIFK